MRAHLVDQAELTSSLTHLLQAELTAPPAASFLPAGWGATPSPATPSWDDGSQVASIAASLDPTRHTAAAAARDASGAVDTASPSAGARRPEPQQAELAQAEHASPPRAGAERSPKLEPLPGASPHPAASPPAAPGRAASKAAGMQLKQLAPARRELKRTSQRGPASQRAALLAAQHEALDATFEAERVLEARIRVLQAQMDQFLAEEGGDVSGGGEPGGGGGGAFLTDAAAADAAEGAPAVSGGSGGGGGGGGRGEKDAAAAGGAGHAPPSPPPPPLRTYSRAGLAALDEVLRRDIGRVVDFFADLDVHESGIVTRSQFRKAMPLLTFAQPSAAKCKRDMDALFDALDTDGVGLVSYKELPQVLESRAASAAARSAPRSRRRAAPPAALLSPTGKVAMPSVPTN